MAYGAGSLADAEVVARALCGGCESASAIGRGTKWSVAREAVWKRWGRRALERRGRETLGSLEQRKRPALCEGRRPHGPEPERLTCSHSSRTIEAKPGTAPPAQGVLTGIPPNLDVVEYTLRQQPIGLPPACPEHFRRDSSRRRCEGIAGRYKQAEGLPRSGGTGLF